MQKETRSQLGIISYALAQARSFYVPCVRRFFLAFVALDPVPFVLDETTLVGLFVLLVFFDTELEALVPLDFLDAIMSLHELWEGSRTGRVIYKQ